MSSRWPNFRKKRRTRWCKSMWVARNFALAERENVKLNVRNARTSRSPDSAKLDRYCISVVIIIDKREITNYKRSYKRVIIKIGDNVWRLRADWFIRSILYIRCSLKIIFFLQAKNKWEDFIQLREKRNSPVIITLIDIFRWRLYYTFP